EQQPESARTSEAASAKATVFMRRHCRARGLRSKSRGRWRPTGRSSAGGKKSWLSTTSSNGIPRLVIYRSVDCRRSYKGLGVLIYRPVGSIYQPVGSIYQPVGSIYQPVGLAACLT